MTVAQVSGAGVAPAVQQRHVDDHRHHRDDGAEHADQGGQLERAVTGKVALAGHGVPGERQPGAEQQDDAARPGAALEADAGDQQRAGQADRKPGGAPAAEPLVQEERRPQRDQHRLEADDDGGDGTVRLVDAVVDQHHLQPQPECSDGQQAQRLGERDPPQRRHRDRRQQQCGDQEPEPGQRHRPELAERNLAGGEGAGVHQVGDDQRRQRMPMGAAHGGRPAGRHPCGTLPLVWARLRICSICWIDWSPRPSSSTSAISRSRSLRISRIFCLSAAGKSTRDMIR